LQTSLDKIAANMKAVKFGSEYIHEN